MGWFNRDKNNKDSNTPNNTAPPNSYDIFTNISFNPVASTQSTSDRVYTTRKCQIDPEDNNYVICNNQETHVKYINGEKTEIKNDYKEKIPIANFKNGGGNIITPFDSFFGELMNINDDLSKLDNFFSEFMSFKPRSGLFSNFRTDQQSDFNGDFPQSNTSFPGPKMGFQPNMGFQQPNTGFQQPNIASQQRAPQYFNTNSFSTKNTSGVTTSSNQQEQSLFYGYRNPPGSYEYKYMSSKTDKDIYDV